MNKILESIINFFKPVLTIIIMVVSVIAMFTLFRWAGLKGLITFAAGMMLMAYLILSKNSMLMYIIEKTSSEGFVDEIKKS